MDRRWLAASVCLTLVVGAFTPLARSAPAAGIDARIAKTQASIEPFGVVEPAQPGRIVIVKLSVDAGNGFELRTKKKVSLRGDSDSDGDGTRDSRFSTRFDRPRSGTCRIVAIVKRPNRSDLHDEDVFACPIPAFGEGEATITGDPEPVVVDLLIAESGEQMSYGLSYRKRLAADRGMAFLFASDTPNTRFHMQNTLIPLSIAFFDHVVDNQYTVIDIQDMDPCYEEPGELQGCPTFGPDEPYRGALEVNQGAFERWGVSVGDTIVITR